MATTWIGDSFRGSGAIPGSAAPYREASVGDWTASAGVWVDNGDTANRSGSGATVVTATAVASGAQFYALGSGTVGTGVVFEAAVYGGGLLLAMAAGTLFSLKLNQPNPSTPNHISLYDGTGDTFVADSVRSLATKTVLRIEIDATSLRGYVDGVLKVTRAVTAAPGDEVAAAGIGGLTTPPLAAPGTTLIAEYIHVVRNTTSGPLGSPDPSSGAASTLPMLTLDAGAWNHGTASYELPQLYAVPAPIPPTFWAAKVGVREA